MNTATIVIKSIDNVSYVNDRSLEEILSPIDGDPDIFDDQVREVFSMLVHGKSVKEVFSWMEEQNIPELDQTKIFKIVTNWPLANAKAAYYEFGNGAVE